MIAQPGLHSIFFALAIEWAAGLPPLHGNWLKQNAKVSKPATFKPAEHLFICMFRLVLGRIPVKSVEDAPIPLGVQGQRQYVVQHTAKRAAQNWNVAKANMDVIQNGCHLTKPIQHPVRKLCRNSAVLITHAVPPVVGAVEPDCDDAACLEQPG